MRRPRFSAIALWGFSLLVMPTLVGCFEDQESLVLVESEKEANRVLVALEDYGIHGGHKKPRERQRKTFYEILVPADQAHEARQLLLQLDIPRDPHSGFAEMFSHSGLIPTKTDEQARFVHATAGELERTLEVVGRVVQARVHLVMPERDPLVTSATGRSSNSGPTAAVLIKFVPPDDAPHDPQPGASQAQSGWPISREEVKSLIASSVEGLAAENVQVTFTLAPTWPHESPPGGNVGKPVEAPASAVDPKTPNMVQKGLLLGFGIMVLIVVLLVVRLRQVGSEAANHL